MESLLRDRERVTEDTRYVLRTLDAEELVFALLVAASSWQCHSRHYTGGALGGAAAAYGLRSKSRDLWVVDVVFDALLRREDARELVERAREKWATGDFRPRDHDAAREFFVDVEHFRQKLDEKHPEDARPEQGSSQTE